MTTLTYLGVEKSLHQWGLIEASHTRTSLVTDTLRLHAAPGARTIAPIFPSGGVITLKQDRVYETRANVTAWFDGTTTFHGRRITAPHALSSKARARSYDFAGPWDWLEKIPFTQTWKSGGSFYKTTHVFLGVRELTGAYQHTGFQIADILNCAILAGAPLQIGTIEPALWLPIDEKTDLFCATALRQCLDRSPDFVAYFDYATTPPTIHVRRRTSLTAQTVSLLDPQLDNFQYVIRDDLVPTCVAAFFERVNVVDGAAQTELIQQIAPPGATGYEDGALSATINLAGSNISNVYSTITTGIFRADHQDDPAGPDEPTNAARLKWWKAKNRRPDLASQRVRNLKISEVSVEQKILHEPGDPILHLAGDPILDGNGDPVLDGGGQPTYYAGGEPVLDGDGNPTYYLGGEPVLDGDGNETFEPVPDLDREAMTLELLAGDIFPWMLPETQQTRRVFITAQASYDFHKNPADIDTKPAEHVLAEELRCEATLTNLPSDTYATLESAEEGEAVPTGLAAYIYASLSEPQAEGSFDYTDGDLEQFKMGDVLNFTDGEDALATVRALVQSVSTDIRTRRVSVRFGFCRQLDIRSLNDLLHFNRVRRRWTNPATQQSGLATSAGTNLTATPGRDGGIKQVALHSKLTVRGEGFRFIVDSVAKTLQIDDGVVNSAGVATGRRIILDITKLALPTDVMEIKPIAPCVGNVTKAADSLYTAVR